MLSRGQRAALAILAVAALAAAAAAWWTAPQWVPHAGPWAQQAWRKLTRPGPETLPQGKAGRTDPAGRRTAADAAQAAPPPAPRKCVRGASVVYTDQPCPPGSREEAVDGAVTTLPGR